MFNLTHPLCYSQFHEKNSGNTELSFRFLQFSVLCFFSQKKEAIFHISFQFFQITQQAEVFFSNIQHEKPVFQTTGHFSTLWYILVSCHIFIAYYPGWRRACLWSLSFLQPNNVWIANKVGRCRVGLRSAISFKIKIIVEWSIFISRIILVEPNRSCSRNALQSKTVFDHSVRMPPRFLLWKTGFFSAIPLINALPFSRNSWKRKK